MGNIPLIKIIFLIYIMAILIPPDGLLAAYWLSFAISRALLIDYSPMLSYFEANVACFVAMLRYFNVL